MSSKVGANLICDDCGAKTPRSASLQSAGDVEAHFVADGEWTKTKDGRQTRHHCPDCSGETGE